MEPRKPLNWITVREITAQDNSGITIQINQTDERRPRFSIRIGRTIEKDGERRVAPFIPVFFDGTEIRSVERTISELLIDAERFIDSIASDARKE